MPNTTLEGASIFSERLREVVQQRMPLTISAGLGVASKGDSPQTLLSRADSALYRRQGSRTKSRVPARRHRDRSRHAGVDTRSGYGTASLAPSGEDSGSDSAPASQAADGSDDALPLHFSEVPPRMSRRIVLCNSNTAQ